MDQVAMKDQFSPPAEEVVSIFNYTVVKTYTNTCPVDTTIDLFISYIPAMCFSCKLPSSGSLSYYV